MAQSGNYMAEIPVKTMDEEALDKDVKVKLTGISGDIIRTLISYEIEDNPNDYQVEEAFLVDDGGRVYCLVSVERKKINDQLVSWMEFGPVATDSKELELKITTLRQAPFFNAFKMKGRSFVDPWDSRAPLTREQLKKMDCWLGQSCSDEEDPDEDWRLRGEWNFMIPMGQWNYQDIDSVTPLDIQLKLGDDQIIIREFRTSNTGAFILVESRNHALQQLGSDFKKRLMEVFDQSEDPGEFNQKLALMGVSKSYTPADLTLRILDQKKMSLYSPDFRDPRGVIHNRIYHFFDDKIYGKFLDVLVMEIRNVKPLPALEVQLDFSGPDHESILSFDMDMGSLSLSGKLVMEDLSRAGDVYQVRYTTVMNGDTVERISITDATLVIDTGDGEIEELPSLGSKVRWDPGQEKLIKHISFPALHQADIDSDSRVRLQINMVDVKLKKPLVFPFRSTPGVPRFEDPGE